MAKGKIPHIIHKKLYHWVKKKEIITLPNYYFHNYEMDIFCLTKKEFIVEYEVKVDKQDFKIDFLKSHHENGVRVFKHDLIKSGLRSNKFYFVVPSKMISSDEVPSYAGLIYFRERLSDFEIVKPAPILHKRTPNSDFYKSLCRSMAFRESNIRVKFYRHG